METESRSSLLKAFLDAHARERELMTNGSSEELQRCIDGKLDIAARLELRLQGDPLTIEEKTLLSQCRQQAQINFNIAQRLLGLAQAKMNLIKSVLSSSYKPSGKHSDAGTGSFFDSQA